MELSLRSLAMTKFEVSVGPKGVEHEVEKMNRVP